MNTPKFTLRKLNIGLVSFGAGLTFSICCIPSENSLVKAEEIPSLVQLEESASEDLNPIPFFPSSDEENQPLNTEEATLSHQISDEEQIIEEYHVEPETSLLSVKDTEEQAKELFTISRSTTVDTNGTMTVITQISPSEIDKGAEVIILLDTSQKMDSDAQQEAKEKITHLVTTLTDRSTPFHSRNSVRLIGFNRSISIPVEVNSDTIASHIQRAFEQAAANYNWGVDLQGAIHTARTIFSREAHSGKQQYIVLFSQGEATFSFAPNEDALSTLSHQLITEERVEYSNPLLPWPFVLDTSIKKANIVTDLEALIALLNKIGIHAFDDSTLGIASLGNGFLSFGDFWGLKNPLDYISMAELDTSNLLATDFNYEKQIGEGYHLRSFHDRKTSSVGLRRAIIAKVKQNLRKAQAKLPEWNTLSKKFGLDSASQATIDWFAEKAVDYLFYSRQYLFHNHNLSAQAEAKLASKAGIHFYTVDITKNDARFDGYLKKMSSHGFLDVSDKKLEEQFQQLLTSVEVIDTLEDGFTIVSVPPQAKLTSTQTGGWFFSGGANKTSLSWKVLKEELLKAYQQEQPLTLTYQIRPTANKEKAFTNKKVLSSQVKHTLNAAKQAMTTKLPDLHLSLEHKSLSIDKKDSLRKGDVLQPETLPPLLTLEEKPTPNQDVTSKETPLLEEKEKADTSEKDIPKPKTPSTQVTEGTDTEEHLNSDDIILPHDLKLPDAQTKTNPETGAPRPRETDKVDDPATMDKEQESEIETNQPSIPTDLSEETGIAKENTLTSIKKSSERKSDKTTTEKTPTFNRSTTENTQSILSSNRSTSQSPDRNNLENPIPVLPHTGQSNSPYLGKIGLAFIIGSGLLTIVQLKKREKRTA